MRRRLCHACRSEVREFMGLKVRDASGTWKLLCPKCAAAYEAHRKRFA